MSVPSFVVYKGEKFLLQSKGCYYQSGRKDGERLLHRRIWIDANGEIPKDMHVHHINGDWTDNRLENLELIDRKLHQSEHMRKRFESAEYQAKNKEDLKLAQDAAKEWHASEEGLAWHSEHGKKTWEGREPVKAICSVCGKEYETYFPTRSRFCSRSCEQKQDYIRHKTAVGVCEFCGKEFTYNKYRKRTCCSRACANRLRAR